MLTARGDHEDRLAGVETGVNAYLTKPFSPRELLAIVRGNIRRSDVALAAAMRSQMASLETVAGGLAHEINNPLNYIKQSLSLIERDLGALETARAAGEDAKAEASRGRIGKFLETARSGVARIAGTVGVMQRYAKEGFNRAERVVDVFALARDAAAIVAPATGGRATIALDLHGDGRVVGVADELQQVVSNLIQNALEAAPEGVGRVRVRGAVEEGAVVLRVADNGPGVPPADRQRIFRPFFTTKDASRGLGMGLAIVWRVVQEHCGEILVTEAEGGGAMFVVRLPVAPEGAA
jgi:signal transduction histidine kinase